MNAQQYKLMQDDLAREIAIEVGLSEEDTLEMIILRDRMIARGYHPIELMELDPEYVREADTLITETEGLGDAFDECLWRVVLQEAGSVMGTLRQDVKTLKKALKLFRRKGNGQRRKLGGRI